METRKYLTEKETALMLSVSVYTLRAHRQKNKGIPYVKIGRAVRYALSDVLAFMNNHRISFEITKAEEEELILRIGELGGKGLGLGSIRIQLRLTEKQFLRLYARGLELGLFEPFSSDDVILAKHLPLSLRKALGLNSEDSVQVISKNDEILLKKFIIN